MPGPFVPIDSIDSEPSMYRFYRRLSSFCRVIRFDHRGMGMSSRIGADKITPACWAEDAVAVMDAVGCESATIMCSGYTAMSALFLAADRPERVANLVVVNGAARVLWAPDYEVGHPPRHRRSVRYGRDGVRRRRTRARRPRRWSRRRSPTIRPSGRGGTPPATGPRRRAWPGGPVRPSPTPTCATSCRSSPRRRWSCTARTRAFVGVGHGRYLAENIAGARYVELPGADTLYWVGDATPILAEIEEFVTGSRGGSDAERVLTTIVFTDIVGSTQRAAALGDDHWRDLLDSHDNLVRRELARFGGREVNTAGDGFVATFSSPSVALDCAEQIVGAVATLGVDVRVGIHAGEVEAPRTGRRRHGGAHRRADHRAGGPRRGVGLVDGARDRDRFAPSVHRARRAPSSGACPAPGGVYALCTRASKPLPHNRIRHWRTGAGNPTA